MIQSDLLHCSQVTRVIKSWPFRTSPVWSDQGESSSLTIVITTTSWRRARRHKAKISTTRYEACDGLASFVFICCQLSLPLLNVNFREEQDASVSVVDITGVSTCQHLGVCVLVIVLMMLLHHKNLFQLEKQVRFEIFPVEPKSEKTAP